MWQVDTLPRFDQPYAAMMMEQLLGTLQVLKAPGGLVILYLCIREFQKIIVPIVLVLAVRIAKDERQRHTLERLFQILNKKPRFDRKK